AGGGDPVALPAGVDLDLIDRVPREGDVAGHVQGADRVARREGARVVDAADRAGAAERAAGSHIHRRVRQRAVHRQQATVDAGRAGERAVAGQVERAVPGFAEEARPGQRTAEGRVARLIDVQAAAAEGDVAAGARQAGNRL